MGRLSIPELPYVPPDSGATVRCRHGILYAHCTACHYTTGLKDGAVIAFKQAIEATPCSECKAWEELGYGYEAIERLGTWYHAYGDGTGNRCYRAPLRALLAAEAAK